MKLKDAIAYSLVISLGIILVIHFALFWVYGGVFIYEDNKVILAIETIMSLAILIFGIERLLNSASEQYYRADSSIYHEDIQKLDSTNRPHSAISLPTDGEYPITATTIATASSMVPNMANHLINNSADHSDSCFFKLSNHTQDDSSIYIDDPDAGCKTT